ncbi:hypothetical protein ACJ8PU_23140 [Serratia sp. CY81489]|uniref:hypothetical protein n=1 Tax=Serratia TaxID=613 RepID=UPI00132AB989|nr:hypothetical protein [Serratia marcescens]MXS96324.1 hypothetical protein [Serratia marcescens]QHJ28247.1 hypothetical protein GV243_21520 [Serratia marcescens]
MNGISLVTAESHEWHYMWAELAKHAPNRELSDPTVAENFGEVWQYMETQEVDSLWKGKRLFHCFRHRLHPVKGAYYQVRIPASRHFDPAGLQPAFQR